MNGPEPAPATIRVELPSSLCLLSRTPQLVLLPAPGEATQNTLLDALEAAHPALRGTIRDRVTGRRRPFLRFFAGGEDLSHHHPDEPLPTPVRTGHEPFIVIGAVAGG